MSICKLMIEDFKKGYGRFENGVELYSDYDLKAGIDFAKWLLEDGLKETSTPPVWNCKRFIKWAKKKLKK